jgi:hypothetical protein
MPVLYAAPLQKRWRVCGHSPWPQERYHAGASFFEEAERRHKVGMRACVERRSNKHDLRFKMTPQKFVKKQWCSVVCMHLRVW